MANKVVKVVNERPAGMLILAMMLATSPVYCKVVDGDSLRCGRERVRLLGIDAPEMGKCPQGRKCVKGNGQASKAALHRFVAGKPVRLERYGKDRHGRTLAYAYVGKVNLSCAQIQGGYAVYVRKWDNGGKAARCK